MVKKLKVYFNKFKKKVKYALVPIALATTVTLSGCSLFANGNKAKYKTDKNTSISQNNNSIVSEIDEDNVVVDEKNTIIEGNIPLNSTGNKLYDNMINYKNNAEFISYLNNLNTKYDFENLYNLDNVLNEYNKLSLTNKHDNCLSSITVDELMNKVLKNNEKYKKENKSSIYRELKNKEIRNLCEMIVNVVNDFVKGNDSIDVSRIRCVLGDLKILSQKSSFNNAFVTDDNCLVVSPNMLEVAQLINGKGTDEDVLIHEINHLLQKGCNCDLNKNSNLKRNYGFSYGFKNIGVNSLDFSWIYEASAEKNMVNYTGHEPLVYKNRIGYLESLSLVNITNENYKVNDTEKLSFKRDLNDLYNYFNVSSDKDKREILNMMYSLEVMQTSPDDFYKNYKNQTGNEKTGDLVDEVNYTVKSSVCKTLTKLFYRNLSNNIKNKNVTIGDIFYLIHLFENDLNNHILYDSNKNYNYNKDFMNTYIDIQNNFFNSLAKNINSSQNDIIELFNNYTANVKLSDSVTVSNYSLNILSNDKIKYLNQRQKDLSKEATNTIRVCNTELNNQKQK